MAWKREPERRNRAMKNFRKFCFLVREINCGKQLLEAGSRVSYGGRVSWAQTGEHKWIVRMKLIEEYTPTSQIPLEILNVLIL